MRKPFGDKYIEEPKTVGECLRNRRLELGLLQKDVAETMGVSEDCIRFWENNQAVPTITYMPNIIKFLGYMPIQIDTSSLGGQIYDYRLEHGLSYKKMGKLVGVDASTIGAWEKGKHHPRGNRLKKLKQVLAKQKLKAAGKEFLFLLL